MLRDLREVRRVVGAFAEQRVAVDAVLAVPHVLAGDHLRRDRCPQCVSSPNSSVAVNRQPDKDEREHGRADNEEETRLPSGHAHLDVVMRRHSPVMRCPNQRSAVTLRKRSDADAREIADADPRRVDHRNEHDQDDEDTQARVPVQRARNARRGLP